MTGDEGLAMTRALLLVSILPLALTALFLAGCAQDTARPAARAEPSAPSPAPAEAPAIPGEVLVQFRAGTSNARIEEILATAGARAVKSLGTPHAVLVRPSGGDSADELIVRLRKYPEVQFAEPNRIRRIEPPPELPGSKRSAPTP
jgi:hypothetical protein